MRSEDREEELKGSCDHVFASSGDVMRSPGSRSFYVLSAWLRLVFEWE